MKYSYLAGLLIGKNEPIPLTSAQEEYIKQNLLQIRPEEGLIIEHLDPHNDPVEKITEHTKRIIDKFKDMINLDIIRLSTMSYDEIIKLTIDYSQTISDMKKRYQPQYVDPEIDPSAYDKKPAPTINERPTYVDEAINDFWEIIGRTSLYIKERIKEQIEQNQTMLSQAHDYIDAFTMLTVITEQIKLSAIPTFSIKRYLGLLQKYAALTSISVGTIAKFAFSFTNDFGEEAKMCKIFPKIDTERYVTLGKERIVLCKRGFSDAEYLIDCYIAGYDFSKLRNFGEVAVQNLNNFMHFYLSEITISEMKTRIIQDDDGTYRYA